MRKRTLSITGLSLVVLAGCQSVGPASTPVAANDTEPTAAKVEASAYASPPSPSSAQCAIAIAAGPPPKPAKGADFGSAAVKNVGKNVSRNVISGIAGRVAGPLGGAVAGGLAMHTIRPEQDLKGHWTATDGSPTCGCALDISSGINLQGKTATKGRLAPRSCGNPLLAQAQRWSLGYSFTGYDAPFELVTGNGKPVATLKRNGMDHFSGTLADGTPITIWRK